jgi:hypothetical protein
LCGSITPGQKLVSSLLASQNPDGGWGYGGAGSWTEPTAFSLLALGDGGHKETTEAAFQWLRKVRRSDGGWSPAPSIDQSTWVTALVLLLLAEAGRLAAGDPGYVWLLTQKGRESTPLFRVRRFLLGVRSEYKEEPDGWPWYPETAAWVFPTAITILALRKVRAKFPSIEADWRIQAGERYLFARMCHDGGWNHGSSRALGHESGSYPETTGLALLALRGAQSAALPKAITRAEEHLKSCRSSQGLSWLQLGLAAHNRPAKPPDGMIRPCRGSLEVALRILAEAALGGANRFLS